MRSPSVQRVLHAHHVASAFQTLQTLQTLGMVAVWHPRSVNAAHGAPTRPSVPHAFFFRDEADRLLLTIPTSKTDPFRHGVTLTISPASDAACPLAAIQNLRALTMAGGGQLDLLQPLFVRPNNLPFSRDYVVRCLRLCLTHQGITGHYSGHSFRRGAATSARLAGLTDHEIQLLGRWQSDAYKRYIEVHPDQLLAISRRLQARRLPAGTRTPRN
jgi:hypothetical protein